MAPTIRCHPFGDCGDCEKRRRAIGTRANARELQGGGGPQIGGYGGNRTFASHHIIAFFYRSKHPKNWEAPTRKATRSRSVLHVHICATINAGLDKSSVGDGWRRRRRREIIQPCFHARRISSTTSEVLRAKTCTPCRRERGRLSATGRAGGAPHTPMGSPQYRLGRFSRGGDKGFRMACNYCMMRVWSFAHVSAFMAL